jgi:TRAP-type C4-dicarboxylate transport system permease large subunit
MVRAGYSKELAVAVVSAASAMGILVPPCILMIVIGSVASLSVAALFTAGFLPAVVMALVLMAYIWRTAGVVSWFLTVQQMPAAMIRIMTVVPGSSLIFLFITAAIFIFFGAVIEGLPAVVILLPSLLPVAAGLGIDPIHYAIVIVAAVGIGLFLPPIGVGLFIACGIAEVSVDRATRAMLPFVAVLLIGLVIIILVPPITLILPRLFKLL